MEQVSIIMPFLNEEDEPLKTVESIYATAPKDLFQIIAIDDASDKKTPIEKLKMFDKVRLIKNKDRLGVDGCRQIGVEASETPYVFIIDAHMRFKKDNWLQKIIRAMEKEPETAWCTTCLGLGYGSMDVNKFNGKYYGATMLFYDKNANKNRPAREILEPKWASKKEGIEYEIPCILGANYGFSRKWFDHIKGLKGLKMWGTSEPFLSLKTWMAGGKCKIKTDIEIGHCFRSNAPYVTQISALVYNKLFLCKTILPENISDALLEMMPNDINYQRAIKQIDENKEEIAMDRQYYLKIFKSDIYAYCSKFDIDLPF